MSSTSDNCLGESDSTPVLESKVRSTPTHGSSHKFCNTWVIKSFSETHLVVRESKHCQLPVLSRCKQVYVESWEPVKNVIYYILLQPLFSYPNTKSNSKQIVCQHIHLSLNMGSTKHLAHQLVPHWRIFPKRQHSLRDFAPAYSLSKSETTVKLSHFKRTDLYQHVLEMYKS